MTQSFTIGSLAELECIAGEFAKALCNPLRVYLSGHIGAGKTTLTASVLKALGYSGIVKSPTFTFVEIYPLPAFAVYHLDLYRLKGPEELEFLGVRDYLEGEGICFVEWPERGGRELPPADIDLVVNATDDIRVIDMSSQSNRGKEVLKRLGRLIHEGRL
ncbi:MAG: tRNA (adenosine(37)-N6)-threonylcarbamoyltransferase complex ATPase subunit type 1 TsaE [Acidiferrobacteraceae bacterium]